MDFCFKCRLLGHDHKIYRAKTGATITNGGFTVRLFRPLMRAENDIMSCFYFKGDSATSRNNRCFEQNEQPDHNSENILSVTLHKLALPNQVLERGRSVNSGMVSFENIDSNMARVVHNDVQADRQFQAYQALFKLAHSTEEWARQYEISLGVSPGVMIILAWDYKGLARPFAVRSLHALVSSYNPDILVLSKTMIKWGTFRPKLRKLHYYNSVHVEPRERSGGFVCARKKGIIWNQLS
ncbi:hypothetical protein TorRG33x02_209410 [Trema orientale]|uniref:Endonuclease/exonuclease/phosphatase n=1 Tax=Trema orientale TaxID=63057 RepID=A0A2P5ECG2_TREOI|nr:hypothetical protein TorRG33x02_209410 [Trema orientale]